MQSEATKPVQTQNNDTEGPQRIQMQNKDPQPVHAKEVNLSGQTCLQTAELFMAKCLIITKWAHRDHSFSYFQPNQKLVGGDVEYCI